jgi:hypothetical protein
MSKKSIIYLAFVGLIGLLSSCEKDGTNVVMLANPKAPTLQTIPDLTLKRTNGRDTLTFVGTPLDPGFQASATYILEAAAAGTSFADPISIVSGVKDKAMKITVSDLNGLLLKKFPADQASSVDFRIRALLTVDSGTGAPGSSSNPMQYSSETKTVSVTPYGLPRLDLIGSGIDQKIESALGDGKYSGYVKLDKSKPFILKNPDNNTSYGANGSALAVNGTGITSGDSGWYMLKADINALTYSMDAYMIGLVGSATPNGWNSPDQKMDYDAKTGTWKITITLVDGEFKFRLNDGWAWNLGGTADNLTQGGANIPVSAGNYTISLTIINGTTGTFTIVKN